jgi:pimeloyl-ACP methyl ester carboxylesterase
MSISPIVFKIAGRLTDIELRLSVPTTGETLPVIIFIHGAGRSNWLSSIAANEPLYHFWASRGFAVIMATHLHSSTLGLKPIEGNEYFWKSTLDDVTWIIDHLSNIESDIPEIQGRLDKSKIAVGGHSLGAWEASILLGATNTDPRTGETMRHRDERIKAGVLLACTGSGADILEEGAKLTPWYNSEFSAMTKPTLIVAGEFDELPQLTARGPSWFTDPYHLAPGSKDLFLVGGGKHMFGGVTGWSAAETDDDSPERLSAVQRMTWAYLRSALYEGDDAWAKACKAIEGLPTLGSTQSKS